ncbi:MAG: TIR domain-containing protein [Caulobacterales bacterium]
MQFRGFISYSWQDKAWGRRLHAWLEAYHAPAGVGSHNAVSRKLGKFFRDDDDMPAASDIGQIVRQAIAASEHLIVLCSPRAAKSKWVNAEIEHFRRTVPTGQVFAVIIDGQPNSSDPDLECFPPGLRLAHDPGHPGAMPIEPVGVDLRRDGKERVCARLAAGMLGVDFDELWQRGRRRKEMRQNMLLGGLSALSLVFGVLLVLAVSNGQRAHDTLSRFFAERAWQKLDTGETLLAARYALAGRQIAPPNEPRFLGALGAVLHAAGDSRPPLLHTKPVMQAAFSADSRSVVTGAQDGQAKIWDVASGGARITLRANGAVTAVAYDQEGERVAAATSAGGVQVWRSADGALLATFKANDAGLRAIGFYPDGSRLYTLDAANVIRVWNIATQRAAFEIAPGEASVWSVALAANGARLVAARSDNSAILYDANTGARPVRLNGHTGAVFQARFSPNGQWLVTASEDGDARIWDTRTGAMLRTLAGHSREVLSAAFASDNDKIVTASVDRTARVWSRASGAELLTLSGHNKFVSDAVFSPDRSHIITTSEDGAVRLWDSANGRLLKALRGHIGPVSGALAANGVDLVTWGADAGARLWSLTPERRLLPPSLSESLYSVEYGVNGKTLATTSSRGVVTLWSAETGAAQKQITVPGGEVYTVAFAEDGRLVTTGEDGVGRIWAPATGAEVTTLAADSGLNAAQFSPDGATIIAPMQVGGVGAFSATDGRLLRRYAGQTGAVFAAAYSADGKRIASGGEDRIARVFDAATGATVAILQRHNRSIGALAFSPDGALIVTASDDTTAIVWDIARKAIKAILPGNGSAILSVAFTQDATRIVTTDDQGLAQIWDARDGRLLATFQGPTQRGLEGALSPDAQTLAGAGRDGALTLWDVHQVTASWPALAREACRNLLGADQRHFTKAEIDADALLGALWPDPGRDVCAGVPGVAALRRQTSARP